MLEEVKRIKRCHDFNEHPGGCIIGWWFTWGRWMTSYRLIGGHSHLKLSRHFIGSSHSERFRKIVSQLIQHETLALELYRIEQPLYSFIMIKILPWNSSLLLCFLIKAKKEISIGKIFKILEFEECFEVWRMGSKWWTNFGLENRVTGKHSGKKQQSNSYGGIWWKKGRSILLFCLWPPRCLKERGSLATLEDLGRKGPKSWLCWRF